MITTSKTNEQAFEWLIERALVGSTKEEREAAGLTDVDAQQPDAQQYNWGLPKDLDKKWAVDMRRLWSFLETTQKEELEKYTGSDIKTEVTKLLSKEIETFGVIKVLREGFEVNNMKLNINRVRVAMARKSYRAADVAEGYGCSVQRIRAILNSNRITERTAGKLAKALDCDVLDIIETEK